MTATNDKRYIYKNHRGGWSICDLATAEVGNYPSALHAIEVASRDCTHVVMLTPALAKDLAQHYYELASQHYRAGRQTAAFDCHGWALWIEIAGGQLALSLSNGLKRESESAASMPSMPSIDTALAS